MLELLGFPPAASAHAADIDRINVLVHWLMLVLFICGMVMIGLAPEFVRKV